MNAGALLVVIAMGCAPAFVLAGEVTPQQARPTAEYMQALRAAGSFLTAWVQRDADAGIALMSSAELAADPGDRVELSGGLRQYMTGLSNSHHAAFEIGQGRQVASDSYAFPVRLFELATGEPVGFVYSDTLGVVREREGWRVD